MKKMVSVMLETALAIALACVGIGAARTAASAEEGKLTLLGDTDTYEESHWQDYLPAPEAVQGDNQWTVYAGTVEGTRIECTLQNGGVWWRPADDSWSGAYYRGYFNCAGGVGAVASWEAPEDGTVKFKGRLGVDILGDGFTYKIYNEKESSATLIDAVSFTAADSVAYLSGIELEVKKGEKYAFEMTPVSTAESRSEVHIFADFTRKTIVSENTLLGTAADFDEAAYTLSAEAWYPAAGNTEGANNWYTYYGSVTGTLNELSFVGDNYWIANNPNNWTGVWYGHVAKSCLGSPLVFAWKAPHGGTVSFNGRAMATNTLSGTARSFILRTYKNTGDAIVRYDEKTVAAEEVVYFSDVAAEVSYGDIFYFEFVSVDGSETDVWVDLKPAYTLTAAQAKLTFGENASDINAYVGDKVTLPVPEKTGYAFKGWKLGEELFAGEIVVSGNADFTAAWEIKRYKISFENCDLQEIEVEYNAPIDLTAPEKTGHTFKGWTKDGVSYLPELMPAEDLLLKAEWEVNVYKVTFENCDLAEREVEYNAPIEAAVPIKTGHTFRGWTKDGAPYEAGVMPAENITLRAEWEINSYRLSFENCDLAEIEIAYNAQISVSAPTKTGYTFKGWTKNGEAYQPDLMPAEDIVLAAVWEINTYKITFENCDRQDMEVEYNAQIVVAPPEKEGYTFKGWTKDGAPYTPGLMPAENMTLSAVWEKTEIVDSSEDSQNSSDSASASSSTNSGGTTVNGCGGCKSLTSAAAVSAMLAVMLLALGVIGSKKK